MLKGQYQEGVPDMRYKVSLTTKLRPPQTGLIVVEPEDYAMAEIHALKKSGATVLAYLSIGSVSDERPYYKKLKPYQLKRLEDWPHERYIDLRRPQVREWIQKQARALKGAGFSGWWLDNVDVYEEYKTTEMFDSILLTIQGIKAIGGYVMINGGMAFLTDMLIPHKVQLGAYKEKANARRMARSLKAKGFNAAEVEMDGLRKIQAGAFGTRENADKLVEKLHAAGFDSAKRITMFDRKPSAFINGVTQEEVFSLITDYDGAGKFGKQSTAQSEAYQTHIRRLIKAGIDAYLLEYTRDNTLKLRIRAFCEAAGATACISDDVNL